MTAKLSGDKSRFLDTVTTDFLTNLNNIALAVELLRRSSQQWTGAQKQSLDCIQIATYQMSELIGEKVSSMDISGEL